MRPLRRRHRGRIRYARCRRCVRTLAYVDEVGWIDPDPRQPYDLCTVDPYGNHQPEPSPQAKD